MTGIPTGGMLSSISRRYAVFAGLIAVLVVASFALLGVAVVLGSNAAERWHDATRAIASVDELNADLLSLEAAANAAIESDSRAPIRTIEPDLAPALALARSILSSADTPRERAVAARALASERLLVTTWIAPGQRYGHTSDAEMRMRKQLLSAQIDQAQNVLLAYAATKRGTAAARDASAATTRKDTIVIAAALLAVALGLLATAALLLGRLVVRPARELELAVSRVTRGDLDTDVPVTGPQELASIAARFNEMRGALKEERMREEERVRSRLDLVTAKQEAARLESLTIVSGGVAHEFNNLLQAIIGQAELLRPEIPERSREGFDDIERAAWKAGRLARTMLLASGRGSYVQAEVVTADIVESLDEFTDCSVDLGYESAEPTLTLVGDASHLRQAVGAVVTNACEAYGDEVGRVEIRVERQTLEAHELARLMHSAAEPGEFVVVTVEDDGEGMSEQTASRAFDPFFTTRFPGRGLGLATALGVVRGHNGAIDIASERGSGTTVRLFFPRAA
jgi:signal transduction histidine kinase